MSEIERNRNDGKLISLDEETHIILSTKCPNDKPEYNVDYAICQVDGSVWIRLDFIDEIHKSNTGAP